MNAAYLSALRDHAEAAWAQRPLTAGIRKARPRLAFHGLQRSGTNHSLKLLRQGGIYVLNRYDPPRNHPRHKHFRWQDDKTSISTDPRYFNTLHAADYRAINLLCRYPADTPHLVVFRPPQDWLASLMRWGQENSWFKSPSAAMDAGLIDAALKDWDSYHFYWHKLARKTPRQIRIHCHNDICAQPSEFIENLRQWLGAPYENRPALKVPITKVRHSRHMDAPRRAITLPALSFNFQFDWRSYTAKSSPCAC